MSTEVSPKRITLGPVATALMTTEAGNEEPNREHLDAAISRLLIENRTTPVVANAAASLPAADPHNASSPKNTTLQKLAVEAHLQLLELRKLCVAGFIQVSGDRQSALVEMERDMTQHQRQSLERIGVDLSEFESEKGHHDRELQQQIVVLKEKELGPEEKER